MAEFGLPFLHVDSVQIVLKNVQFGNKMVLDEMQLNGSNIHLKFDGDAAKPSSVTSDETTFRGLMTEANLNALLESNMPPDVPVTNLRVSLLSGKLKLSAQLIKFLKMPLSVEGVVRVDNGSKVYLEWEDVHFGGIPLPSQLVEMLQNQINKSLDLTTSPVPVWLDWVRCEPGRLSISGKARLNFPINQIGIDAPNEHAIQAMDTYAVRLAAEDRSIEENPTEREE